MSRHPSLSGYYVLALSMCLAVGTVLHYSLEPKLIWSVLAAVNLTAFSFNGYDKSLAVRQAGYRVPEKLLFLLALCGGSAGTIVGMGYFRHKIRKASFLFVLLIILAVQAYLLRFVLSHEMP